ncbi:MAG: hypothetical protein AABY22_23820 [Nanoarchaeota archaeon]
MQNAKTLINMDTGKVQEVFIEQITTLTKKTNITIRQMPIFEYLGIDDAIPKRNKYVKEIFR